MCLFLKSHIRLVKLIKNTLFSVFLLLVLLRSSVVFELLFDENSSCCMFENSESTKGFSGLETFNVDPLKKTVNTLYESSLVDFALRRKEIEFLQVVNRVIYLDSISRPPQV